MSNFFSDSVRSGYFMYMAEAEGHDNLVNTRQAQLNAIVNDLRAVPRSDLRINPSNYLYKACVNHSIEHLSDKEVRYIEDRINN